MSAWASLPPDYFTRPWDAEEKADAIAWIKAQNKAVWKSCCDCHPPATSEEAIDAVDTADPSASADVRKTWTIAQEVADIALNIVRGRRRRAAEREAS